MEEKHYVPIYAGDRPPGKQLFRKGWGDSREHKVEHRLAVCPCCKGVKWYTELHQEDCYQQVKQDNPSPLLSTNKHLECCGQFWAPQNRKHMVTLESSKRPPRWWMKGLEHLSKEERLWELGPFSLEKKRLRADHINGFKSLMGESKEDGSRLFPVVPSDKTRSNEFKLKHRRFHLNIRRVFYHESYWALARFQRSFGVFCAHYKIEGTYLYSVTNFYFGLAHIFEEKYLRTKCKCIYNL